MILGHQAQWEFLQRIAKADRIPQALLFTGQNHLGKKKVALELVKLLNCSQTSHQNSQGPCQKCFSCQSIAKGRYPDLGMVLPQKKMIQISQIRDLQSTLNLGAQISSIKSVIIDTAESMNMAAQNCLLKTLEEPRGKALLILISSQPAMLAPTIISRTQLLKFYPLRASEIEEYFKGKVSQDFLKKLVWLAEGLPGKAMEFFKNPEKLEIELGKYQFWQKILDSSLDQRFYYLNQLFSKKQKFPQNLGSLLEILLRHLRGLLLEKMGVKKNQLTSFKRTNRDYSPLNLEKMIKAVQDLSSAISRTNINPKLALENLILHL